MVLALYSIVAPVAWKTPCVAIRVETLFANAEATMLAIARNVPVRNVWRRKRVKRRARRPKSTGIDRYTIPLKVVPIAPVDEPLPESCKEDFGLV